MRSFLDVSLTEKGDRGGEIDMTVDINAVTSQQMSVVAQITNRPFNHSWVADQQVVVPIPGTVDHFADFFALQRDGLVKDHLNIARFGVEGRHTAAQHENGQNREQRFHAGSFPEWLMTVLYLTYV